MQWKDKCASYSFTTKKLTNSMCQVCLVVKYTNLIYIFVNIYENIKQRKKNCRKIKMGISTKLPISHLLIVID